MITMLGSPRTACDGLTRRETLIPSAEVRAACDLRQEPNRLRDRYGANDGKPLLEILA